MNRRGEKRIRRELAAIEDARAEGEPHACGLAIAFNQGDSCPRFYVLRGSQRFSPYSGYVIHFRIQFPSDYPFEPFQLLIQPTYDFFHPLIACATRTGLCAAFIHRLHWWGGDRSWRPTMSVSSLVKEGLLPMWTNGDCWVEDAANPDPYCPHTACFFESTSHTTAELQFPHALPSFEGDIFCWHTEIHRLRCCWPYATNGFNPVAAHLLVADVQRFEHFARKSWSAQMTDECAASIIPLRIMSRLSPITLPRPISQRLQPPPYTPLPPAPWSIVNLCLAPHILCVISGWAARWIIANARTMSQSSSIGNREAWALLLFVWRRVRGVAGVRRLTGYDPSAPRPPGTREHYNASRQHIGMLCKPWR